MLKKAINVCVLLGLSAGVALASPSFRFLAQLNPCGAVPQSDSHDRWCGCYKNYMVNACKVQGGGDLCTNEDRLFEMLDEFGGPSVACMVMPPEEMRYEECVSTLSFYQKDCRVHGKR